MEDTPNVPLHFQEFPAGKKSDWQSKVEEELKNASFETLRWNPITGNKNILMEPYYSLEDIEGLQYLRNFHNSRSHHIGWNNYMAINNQDPDFNKEIQLAVNSGVDGIVLQLNDTNRLAEQADFISERNLHISIQANDLPETMEIIAQQNIKARYVIWDLDDDLTSTLSPQYLKLAARYLCISSNEGDIDQQLLEYLQKLNKLLRYAQKNNIDASLILKKVFVYSKTGTEFFNEIAKLRALRILTEALFTGYSSQQSRALGTHEIDIISESVSFTHEDYQPHGNLIKSTYSAMAAAIGGCNAMLIKPEDNSDLAKSVAGQVSNILKEEAYIGKVSDPAGGSYYIDNLTHLFVSNIWEQFLINNSGN